MFEYELTNFQAYLTYFMLNHSWRYTIIYHTKLKMAKYLVCENSLQ